MSTDNCIVIDADVGWDIVILKATDTNTQLRATQ